MGGKENVRRDQHFAQAAMQKRHRGLQSKQTSAPVIIPMYLLSLEIGVSYAENKNTSHNGRVLRCGELAVGAGEEALVAGAAGDGGGSDGDALGRHIFSVEIIFVFL